MIKYINAELLKEGLKELESVIYSNELVGQSMHPYDCGQLHAINIIKELIDSLEQEQPCEDLPEWKKAYAGTHFGEDVVTISPKGKDFPRVVETALTDCLYIPISELMKLAKKEE